MTQEKNNQTTLVIVALTLALLIAGAFMYMKKSPNAATTGATNTSEPANTDRETQIPSDTSLIATGKNTLMNLMSMGKDIECTFEYATEGKAASKGTMYVSGKRVRGQFETMVDGKTTTTQMLQDGAYMYMWGTSMPEGLKIAIPVITPGSDTPTTNAPSNQYFDANQQMDVACKPWTADSATFTLPSDVTFRDLSSMMKGLPQQYKQ
ncbi:MAG: hypothetical protein UZ22_OP11002000519 [Microgenomates bacterium OLB23]|nr:MAG: hypothetical protein UZ22_OP11002000519 [Microgenomates bacterium OLB23]